MFCPLAEIKPVDVMRGLGRLRLKLGPEGNKDV